MKWFTKTTFEFGKAISSSRLMPLGTRDFIDRSPRFYRNNFGRMFISLKRAFEFSQNCCRQIGRRFEFTNAV